MRSNKQMHLLDTLQRLLEKQVEMARKSDFGRVEALAEQADPIVKRIVELNALEEPEFAGQREYIEKLYKKLELILTAGKVAIGKQLQQVGSGKKTLKAYRNNS